MTVKELIQKLSKTPEDAMVYFRNNDDYYSGDYQVTDIEFWEDDNEVEIVTDYEYIRTFDTDEWDDGKETDDE